MSIDQITSDGTSQVEYKVAEASRKAAHAKLLDATTQSRAEIRSGKFVKFAGATTRDEIFDAYLTSFPTRSSEIRGSLALHPGDMEQEKYLVSRVFEDLSFASTAANQARKGFTVIPEESVFSVIQALHPDARSIENGNGRIGLTVESHGIQVPDGLMVDKNGKIIGFLEYTLGGPDYDYAKKYTGYRNLIRDFGDIVSPEAQLIFVVPKPAEKNVTEKLKGMGGDVGLITLPISYDDINLFINGLK